MRVTELPCNISPFIVYIMPQHNTLFVAEVEMKLFVFCTAWLAVYLGQGVATLQYSANLLNRDVRYSKDR